MYKFETTEYKKEVKTLELDLPNILKDKAYLHFHYSGGYNYYVKILPVFKYLPYDFEKEESLISDELYGYDIWIYSVNKKLVKHTLPLNKIKPELKNNKLFGVSTDPDIKINEEIIYYCLTQSRLQDYYYAMASKGDFDNQINKFLNDSYK